ncbi:MAG: SHOCT domain-containing protein [Actinobacteria bacterium]|nr:SHOCT domain-containing protein [Actinomycetota bacterium]
MPGAQVSVQGSGDPGSALGAGGQAESGDDRVAQLERLAKLKESGALSDAEFEKEKARILGG